jgi:aminoglycoside phosphotransferase (APT) family kinase protein
MAEVPPKGYDPDAFAKAKERRALDLEELGAALTGTLARRLGVTEVSVTELRVPDGAGTSSGTVLFDAAWTAAGGRRVQRGLVARTHPDKVQLFREPDFRKQFTVIDALHRSDRVKVAEALFYEDDASVIGVPFFVMSKLQGWVPVSFPGYNVEGRIFEATPTDRRGLWESAMEELCRIARVPIDGFGFLDQPELGVRAVDQQLEYWHRSIDFSTDCRTPDPVWAMYEWLAANVPADATNGFTWGDARIGNMMFGDDLRLVGVMDWEQANLSGIRMDLAWWLYFDDFHSRARGLTRLDGLGDRDETIAFWEDRVGETAGDLTWYEVFTGFQIGLLSFRTLLILGSPDALDYESNLGFSIARRRLGW